MSDSSRAILLRRFVAALIDAVIAGVLSSVIPFVGFLLGAAYILTKDAIVFELLKNNDFRNKSIGKRLMKLEISLTEGEGYVDWLISLRRNITLAIGSIIMVIPVAGWVVGSIIAFVLGIVECILVLTQPDGRRLGDKIAHTQVIDAMPAVPSAE